MMAIHWYECVYQLQFSCFIYKNFVVCCFSEPNWFIYLSLSKRIQKKRGEEPSSISFWYKNCLMLQLYQVFLYNTYFTTSLIAFNMILKILLFKVLKIIVFYRLWKRVSIVYEFVIFDSLKGTQMNRGIQYSRPKSLILIHTQTADNFGALVACPVQPLHK